MSEWIKKNGVEAFVYRVIGGVTLAVSIVLYAIFFHTFYDTLEAVAFGIVVFVLPVNFLKFSDDSIDRHKKQCTISA